MSIHVFKLLHVHSRVGIMHKLGITNHFPVRGSRKTVRLCQRLCRDLEDEFGISSRGKTRIGSERERERITTKRHDDRECPSSGVGGVDRVAWFQKSRLRRAGGKTLSADGPLLHP